MRDLITISFGKVLRRLRQERGYSQELLGARSKLQRKHISALELGDKQPSILTIFRLADALDISPGKLIAMVDATCRGSEVEEDSADG